jgi:hypothetical protein
MCIKQRRNTIVYTFRVFNVFGRTFGALARTFSVFDRTFSVLDRTLRDLFYFQNKNKDVSVI